MNYNAEIQRIIDMAKADKSIAQPLRNYGVKHLEEAKADFYMGKHLTHLEAPQGVENSEMGHVSTLHQKAILDPSANSTRGINVHDPNAQCECPVGRRSSRCPVHGGNGV